jgi:hypothetical protein
MTQSIGVCYSTFERMILRIWQCLMLQDDSILHLLLSATNLLIVLEAYS